MVIDRARPIPRGHRPVRRRSPGEQLGTRPQTLAYALNDSPVGQLAWNLEWFVDWDPTETGQTPIDRDAILTNVTSFWLTGTANFLGDGAIRGLAELSNTVTHWSTFPTGGHFASVRVPDLLVADIREFFHG